MDTDQQIQQSNLVSDDAAAVMDETTPSPAPQAVAPEPPLSDAVESSTPDPQTDPLQFNPDDESTDEPPAQPSAEPSSDPQQAPPEPALAVPEPPADDVPVADALSDLDVIKKSALDELQPLIQHVEQSPEERYETVMMMIRANDDPKLISEAYDAAKQIENEKARANALLNIVSEIEYLKSKN